MPDALGSIDHFVVLMLENRSFDHLLGWLHRDDPRIDGLVGTESNLLLPADPNSPVATVTDTAVPTDPDVDPGHELADVNEQLFGSRAVHAGALPTNSGFVASYSAKRQQAGKGAGGGGLIMRGFSPANLPVLATLAREFAVCDRWFASVPGPTWPNRFFVHCGWSGGHYDGAFRLYGMRTIYEELEAKQCSWGIYLGGGFGQVFLLTHLYASGRGNNVRTLAEFYRAAQHGRLPSYTFLEPDYFGGNANDEHPPHDLRHGESLIADIYHAVRQSPAWPKTLLIITYDEHGGLYDHVSPPADPRYIPNPKHDPDFDFSRLGVRVPAVLVSPYVPKGTVDHTEYDHTSVLATLTKRFALPGKLSQRVAGAATLEHALSLPTPRNDTPLTVSPAVRAATRPVPPGQPLSDLQRDLVVAARGLEAVYVKGVSPEAAMRIAAAPLATAPKPLARAEAERYVQAIGKALIARARRKPRKPTNLQRGAQERPKGRR
jgi:phospholipase C